MNTKFVSDNLKSKDREELKLIINSLKQNPIKDNIKADFLRKFTLAMIDTFRKEKLYNPEVNDVNINIPEKINLNKVDIPKKIDIPFELFLKAPNKITLPKELLEETPKKY